MSKSLYGLLRRAAIKTPEAIALISPNQTGTLGGSLTYGQLQAISHGLAGFLRSSGLAPSAGGVIVSDLPNITENLILQLACSSLHTSYATVKDAAGLKALRDAHYVVGCVPGTNDSWLKSEFPATSTIVADTLERTAKDWLVTPMAPGQGDSPGDNDGPHAYFSSTKPLESSEIVALGESAATRLNIRPEDRVCVSITLCHAFGIGSGVASVLSRGAALVLPAVGGIRGCGNPSERAAATLEVLRRTDATLLLADTHIIKNFPPNAQLPALRGGVVKTGSGSDFLADMVSVAGTNLYTMGKL